MTNGEKTKLLFSKTDKAMREVILSEIAKHYGITTAEALEEVTGDEAEHLCDYLTGTTRGAVSLFFVRHGIK